MPVPVPRFNKQPAHPVIKPNYAGDDYGGQVSLSVFHDLTQSLPLSPTGPPPSFGTREQWISSLPSWRRAKPRRIWEDDLRLTTSAQEQQHFQPGLVGAGNASAIKGPQAQACIPPSFGMLEPTQIQPLVHQLGKPQFGWDTDSEMHIDRLPFDYSRLSDRSRWGHGFDTRNGTTNIEPMTEVLALYDGGDNSLWRDVVPSGEQVYERGSFTPMFEEESPNANDPASSPLEPVTPFGDFVDRAVAAVQPKTYNHAFPLAESTYACDSQPCGPQCYQPISIADQPQEQVPTAEETPCATSDYKRLAGPLSDWIASYVWKICTTGMSLPSAFSKPALPSTTYSPVPPSYLAGSIHSLLLSTLLQPSAVFLAMWYIVRLPGYFNAASLSPERVKELRFRVALLGDDHTGSDRESLMTSAPFRLVVLGCMLANKWLDDHTFSNKTWHTISNVPIQALNQLESLALDIFSYDLSVTPKDWSMWLSHVVSYHMSLASPSRPQPISRPSSNPHSIVRKAIEEIAHAPSDALSCYSPQPVFLGLAARRREKVEKEQALAVDSLEIDLDEDGPLREEYLPKRRVSGAGSIRSARELSSAGNDVRVEQDWNSRIIEKGLPPPAKWSPAGDEPILRENNRHSGYVAVQPPLHAGMVSYPPTSYSQPRELGYIGEAWSGGVYPKPQLPAYYDVASMYPAVVQSLSHYSNIAPPLSHSRTQSLYDQDNPQMRSHLRTHSQSAFDQRCSDVRMSSNHVSSVHQASSQWPSAGPFGYPGPFDSHIGINHQSSWLRA